MNLHSSLSVQTKSRISSYSLHQVNKMWYIHTMKNSNKKIIDTHNNLDESQGNDAE